MFKSTMSQLKMTSATTRGRSNRFNFNQAITLMPGNSSFDPFKKRKSEEIDEQPKKRYNDRIKVNWEEPVPVDKFDQRLSDVFSDEWMANQKHYLGARSSSEKEAVASMKNFMEMSLRMWEAKKFEELGETLKHEDQETKNSIGRTCLNYLSSIPRVAAKGIGMLFKVGCMIGGVTLFTALIKHVDPTKVLENVVMMLKPYLIDAGKLFDVDASDVINTLIKKFITVLETVKSSDILTTWSLALGAKYIFGDGCDIAALVRNNKTLYDVSSNFVMRVFTGKMGIKVLITMIAFGYIVGLAGVPATFAHMIDGLMAVLPPIASLAVGNYAKELYKIISTNIIATAEYFKPEFWTTNGEWLWRMATNSSDFNMIEILKRHGITFETK